MHAQVKIVHIALCIEVYMNGRIDRCIDMCIYLHTKMYMDMIEMYRRGCRNVHPHVHAHVHGQHEQGPLLLTQYSIEEQHCSRADVGACSSSWSVLLMWKAAASQFQQLKGCNMKHQRPIRRYYRSHAEQSVSWEDEHSSQALCTFDRTFQCAPKGICAKGNTAGHTNPSHIVI